MKESYTQALHYFFSKYCISYRSHPASRWNLWAHPGSRRGFLWSLSQYCWNNWSPELWFGRTKDHWLYRHQYWQAPVHNPIILCNLLLFVCAFKLLDLNENLRCIILGTHCLNTRNRVRIDSMLLGPVKVEWLPVTRELIGLDCLLSAITLRIMDGFGYKLHIEIPLCS